ncbi:ABC transporter ATP-binding protein [Rhodovastum atsumiense]|uniref:ABC transporter ATP-binding protein n=1 Tax=Rhodovastum atsumiense TaxID=504468 RepID=A0A5M6IVA2_9PROT|nr:ABC transporter ATP-binding protein [Rhodovastum atsumiense]KAA5612141.1 ABC transporter ATP-binding protein [Rhodovastum atsumiense]CAH2603916.1 ABC transporter ATP-binding protein [Rhodovastum atsumiense]
MSPALDVAGLRVAYRKRAGGVPVAAVRGVDLAVRPGEVVALVGESGSGKSTVAAVAAGLLAANGRIEAGRLRLDGQEVTDAGERLWTRLRGRALGFIPQDPGMALDPIRRIGPQVAEALTVHGTPPAAARARVPGLLAEAGLADPARVAASFPHELSGGMRQRVLIAIALANDPPLLIADEPTSALDVTVQRQVLDHLEGVIRRRGTAVLLITHDLGVAHDRADRLVVMRAGEVVEQGPARMVFAAPRHDYTHRLLGAATALRAAPAPRPPRPVPEPPPILVVERLVKRFGPGRPAVAEVSFTVPRHGTTSLVGESGSGKTTTARMVLGLEQPDGGAVRFDGQEIGHLSRAGLRGFRRRVQWVGQNPYASLDPRFSIAGIIAEPLRAFGLGDRAGRLARVRELLAQVELPEQLLTSRPAELSGGQRQRVAIARALAIRPELVVLDEPVSALDVPVQAQIIALLLRLQRDLGVSYLFVSHDLAVVRQVSDHVVVLHGGQVVEQGPAEAVFARPVDPYTLSLLNDTPGRRYAVQAGPDSPRTYAAAG